MEPEAFLPHPIEWSPERVRRFWDHYSANPAMEEIYFAKMVGPSLINYVNKLIAIGTVADIGCGRGDLMDLLLKRGHDVYGVDQSPASVDEVRKRFGGFSHFKGASLIEGEIDLPDRTVDTGFLIEVVEHLSDDALATALSEAHRVIRPGGHLVLTTPNQEDLRASETMCPECGSIFHRVQHVRAWSAESLTEELQRFGFEPVSAEGTVLAPYTGPLGGAYRLAYRLVRKRKPHLVYIGRRLPDWPQQTLSRNKTSSK